MVKWFVYLSVSTHTQIQLRTSSFTLYVMLTCDTDANVKQTQGLGLWRSRPHEPEEHLGPRPRLSGGFLSIHALVLWPSFRSQHCTCVAGLFPSGLLARPCLVLFKQVVKQALHLKSKSSFVITSCRDMHIKNIKHGKLSKTL